MKPTRTQNLLLLSGLLLLASTSPMQAANGNDTWTGGAGTAAWSGANWSGANNPPISGDALLFGTVGAGGPVLNNDLAAGATYAGLTFNSGAASFTLNGNSIISTNGIFDLSLNPQTNNLPLDFQLTNTVSVVGGGSLVLNNIISDVGGITKIKNGTVTLTGASAGANTYTGPTTINAGTLTLDFTTGGSTPAADIIANTTTLALGGGRLAINGNVSGTSSQTLAGTTFSPGTAVIVATSNTPTVALGALTFLQGGAVRFEGPATINGAGTVAATGTITTTTAGGGTLGLLRGTSVAGNNPTAAGYATVGLYDWASTSLADGTAGTSPYTIIGGSQVAGFYKTAYTAGGNFDLSVPTQTLTSSGFSDTVRFNNPGGTNITGNGNTVVGGFLITPNMGSTNCFLSGPNWQVQRNGGGANDVQEGVIWQNNLLGYFILNVPLVDGRDANDINRFIKAGDGTVFFRTTTSTCRGSIYVNGGNLVITANGCLGSLTTGSEVDLNGGTLVGNAIFSLDNAGAAPNRAVTLIGSGGGLAASAGNTMTVDGVVGSAAGVGPLTIGIPASSANGNVVGLLPGSGSGTANTTPVKATGTVVLTGANFHTGGTILQSGTVNINGINALGGANYGGLTLNGGTLQYATAFSGNGSGDLTSIGTAGVTVSSGGGTIDPNGNTVTYADSIGNGGSGILTVTSFAPGGVLNLNGNNTYTGGTIVTNGTLLVNNTTGSGTGSGGVTVQNAGTFGGTGIVSGSVNWQPGSKASFTKGSPLTVGVVTLNNNSVTVNVPGGTPLPIGTYTLMNYTAAGSSGSFNTGTPTYTGAGVAAGTLSTIATSGGVVTLSVVASGLTATWNTDVDGVWSDGTKWSSNPNVPHAAGDAATFGVGSALRTVTLDANETVGGILMTNANSFVIANSGKTLTFDNTGVGATIGVNAGTANAIQTAVALNDNVTATVGAGDSLAFSGVVSNSTSGSKTLTFNGAGTNILSAVNSYGPAAGIVGTTLSSGTLQVGNNSSLGSGDVNITGNSTLQSGASGLSLSNNVAVGFGLTATVNNSGNNLTLGGAITGSGAVTAVGAGKLTLNGNNTYSGNTTVNAGVLSISSSANVANTLGIILNGGDLLGNATFTVSNPVKIGLTTGNAITTALVDVAGSQVLTLSGVIASAGNIGTNNLTVNSVGNNGTLVLNNANTFNGTTTIANGTLKLANVNALQNSTLNYNAGTLLFDGSITAPTFAGLSGANNLINLALTNTSGAAVALTVGNNNVSSVYGGILSDIGSLTKIGSGTLTLSNAAYAGNTVVFSGGLVIASPTIFTNHLDISGVQGTANVTISGATVVSPNGLYITSATGGINGLNGILTITNGAQVTANADANGRALSYGNGGTGRPGGNGSLNVGIAGDNTTTVTANGSLDMFISAGGGTVGNFAANLNGGTLAVRNIRQSTSGSQTANFNFNGGILKALTNDTDIAVVFLPANATVVTVNTGGAVINENRLTNTIAAVLAHGTGTPDGGLTVFGGGVLTLSGANTYTGPTTVTNSTLQVASGGSVAGVVNVMTNGYLGGGGTIAGDVTNNIGGHTLPGGTVGNATGLTTSMSGNLTYNTGAEADFNLSPVFNSGNDQITVAGNLNGNGVKVGINVTDLVNNNLDTTADYVLFNVSGTIASGFASLPVWLGLPPNNSVSYSVMTVGNQVVLHYAGPPPITITTASATPNSTQRNQLVTFTVDTTTTAGTIHGVTVNLSAFGGGSPLFSLGQSNGTSVWTNTIVVGANVALNSYNLFVTVDDTSLNTNSSIINLTITSASEVWNGGSGVDNKWSSGLNWTNGFAPLTGDSVTFAGTIRTNANLESGYNIASLTFDGTAGSFNITNGANTLTLTGGVTNNSANAQTLSVPVALSGVQTFNAAAGNITVSNIISGNGGGVVATGNTNILAGNNTYTGPTTVSTGLLVLSGDNSGGLSAVTNGATLRLANANAVKGALTLQDSSTLQLRADADTVFTPASLALNNLTTTLNFDVDTLTGATGKKLTLGGALSYPSLVNAVINVTGGSGDTLVLGAIAGNTANTAPHRPFTINVVPGINLTIASFTTINYGNDLTMQGGGNVTVTGNLANTSNGSVDLFVNGGTVTLQGLSVKTGAGDAYQYYVNSGTLVLDNSGALTNNTTAGAALNVSVFYLGVSNNAAANPSNATVYLGDSNFPNGGLSVNAKTTNYVADGGAAFLNTGIFTIGGQNTSGTNTYANPIILGLTPNAGRSVTLVAANGGEVDFTGGILPNGTDTTAGVTVGDATHGGTVKLIGANTYAGGTTVSNGTLLVSGSLASGVVVAGGTLGGSGTINGAVTNQSGGTLFPGAGVNVAGTTLTVSGATKTVMLGGSTNVFRVSADGHTSGQVVCASFGYGGTLIVLTNAGDAPLTNGSVYKLFNSAGLSFSGGFSTTNYPALSAGLAWSNSLSVDGSIEVISSGVTPPPVAGIGALSATNIFVGQSVVFTNLSSGSITNWIWNFGNGTSVTNASGINVTNAYGSVGSYLVNLTVAGAGGSGTSGNLTVTVKGKVSLGKPVLSGGSLILGGTNGPAGQQYRILSSTNVALNVTNWVAVWTNVFATDGSYSYTNSPLTNKATFFKLVSP